MTHAASPAATPGHPARPILWVAFVALAGLREPHQVADAIATTLDIRGQADRPMLESLLTALARAA